MEEVVPAAGRTVHSLRDIGYELPQAIADLVDNSIEAGADEIRVDLQFEGEDSWIRIADNGTGMDTDTIKESLRIGSIRDYGEDDLGKFGFGLKTASISQCRRVVVASRIALQRARIEARVFDLDHIERENRWEVLVLDPDERPQHVTEPLQDTTGTPSASRPLWTTSASAGASIRQKVPKPRIGNRSGSPAGAAATVRLAGERHGATNRRGSGATSAGLSLPAPRPGRLRSGRRGTTVATR